MKILERLHMMHRLLRYRWVAERIELQFMLGRRLASGSVFDVGAHCGVYSYWMHRHFDKATRVVAFEPQPELVDHLVRFRRAFRLDRLQIEPVGLSSQTGMLTMHRPRAHWGAATVDEFACDSEFMDVFDVPVTTIDDYLTEHPELRPVRFIKCDVEYHEAAVLAGAERTLCEDRPELLVEWSTPRRAYRDRLFHQMQRLGYAIFQIAFGRLTPCTTAERHCAPSWELGANYVLLPRESTALVAA